MKNSRPLKLGFLGLILGSVVVFAVLLTQGKQPGRPPSDQIAESKPATKQDAVDIGREAMREQRRKNPRSVGLPKLTFWWDEIPRNVRQVSSETGPESNIHSDDYAGPQSCQKCHAKNYDQWLQHPHRRMNALATEENVLGDFSGSKRIEYLGGVATFFREPSGGYRMRLARDGQGRIFGTWAALD